MINSCLIIHSDHENDALTISKHYKSFEKYGECFYMRINLYDFDKLDEKILQLFDSLIIHYSAYLPNFIKVEMSRALFKLINFKGKKIVFIQDEYRHIDKTNDILNLLKIDYLYSVCPIEKAKIIYRNAIEKGLIVRETLTGYIDEIFLTFEENKIPIKDIDVSYRARNLKEVFKYLGKKALEKQEISSINSDLIKEGFKTSISTNEKDRVYGKEWDNLLRRSKATLFTISGASVCDFTGKIQESFQNLYKKGHRGKILDDTFSKFDGNLEATAISPRVRKNPCH